MERVACDPSPECKYFNRGCYEDVDHIYWPANQYTDPIERVFRELPENKREICRQKHEERHATEEPPQKPSLEVMEHAIIASGVYISSKARKRLRM